MNLRDKLADRYRAVRMIPIWLHMARTIYIEIEKAAETGETLPDSSKLLDHTLKSLGTCVMQALYGANPNVWRESDL